MSKCIIRMQDPSAQHINFYMGEGNPYWVSGERYAVLVGMKRDAKRYTSVARAKNAYSKLFTSCVNIDFPDDYVEYIEVDE